MHFIYCYAECHYAERRYAEYRGTTHILPAEQFINYDTSLRYVPVC